MESSLKQIKRVESITVETLYAEAKNSLQLVWTVKTDGDEHKIVEKDMHRPGLALAGFVDLFTHHRIQVIGNTESQYLESLPDKSLRETLERFFSFDIPCIIITDGNKPQDYFIELAKEKNISVFTTPSDSSLVFHILTDYLDETFANYVTVHGSLVDVYGIGLLFTGPSGIGKSEIALDLVERGHRLVSDDIVKISQMAGKILIGTANNVIQHHMEIRGVGILDVRRMFGIRGVRLRKRVEVEIQLEIWDENEDYDRTGLGYGVREIMRTEIPLIRLPIFPGKNITVIAEVIALSQLLKIHGYDPASEFNQQLIQKMQEKTKHYLERDFE